MPKKKQTAKNQSNAAARARYERHAYHKLMLRIRQDGKNGFTADQLRHAAEQSGQSVNAWVLEAIRERI